MIKRAIRLGKSLILYNLYYRYLNKYFVFNGKRYKYFYHPYNRTWENERRFEIPIIWDIVEQNRGKRILEVGRVLPHYFSLSHDVLDKYEKSKDVINEDAADFVPLKKYDLIISISTLEHVGWDEIPKEPEKVIRAVENLKECLNLRGKIVFTIPRGENSYLDQLLDNNQLGVNNLMELENFRIGEIYNKKYE